MIKDGFYGDILKGGNMREIKFRAWIKQDKKLVDVKEMLYDHVGLDKCTNKQYLSEVAYRHLKEKGKISKEYIYVAISDCILEQYIGLKDSTGKEIYEGDIVEYDDNINGYYETYEGAEIVYSEEEAMFCFENDDGNLLSGYRNLKVVGNIHEKS